MKDYRGINNPNYKNAGIKICLKCGKQYKSYNSTRKYCSIKCHYSAHRITQICKFCNKEYTVYISRNNHGFCCAFCKNQYVNREGSIVKICEICQKEFTVKKCLSNQRFCSYKCLGEYRKKQFKGEGNPMWDGGREDYNYRGEDWNEQKNKVYERDEGKCQKCGEQIRVSAHHIIPWRFTKDNNIKNLICLCCKCHMNEENSYRRLKEPSLWLRNLMKEKYPN